MNGSTENAAFGAPEKSGGQETVLLWGTAQRMLPLVRRIVSDILYYSKRLAQLKAEKAHLDSRKHLLSWPERCRRYQLHEEIKDTESNLEEASAELEVLGLVLLDPCAGRIGFPTRVNDRRAFFSWQPDDGDVQFWHFSGEKGRRPIPQAWVRSADRSVSV